MTIGILAERIHRIYSGGIPSLDGGIKMADIKHLVIDNINSLLKVEMISLNKQEGDNYPTNLMIATYEDIDVVAFNTVQSRAELPAIPVSLPLGMGVWSVAPDTQTTTAHDVFVPLQTSQWSLIKDFSPLVGSGKVLGNYVYTLDGKYITFPTDIHVAMPKIVIKLVILDISTLGDFDLLPMPADYSDQVIKNVLSILGVVPPVEDVINDGNTQK